MPLAGWVAQTGPAGSFALATGGAEAADDKPEERGVFPVLDAPPVLVGSPGQPEKAMAGIQVEQATGTSAKGLKGPWLQAVA